MVPLIFETNSMNQYQRILVVDCDEELQISRATKRDNSNKENIQKILNSQFHLVKKSSHIPFL